MDFETPPPVYVEPTVPTFLREARDIAKQLGALDPLTLQEIMHVSSPLALAVHKKYAAWGSKGTVKKPALWAYKGDVYKGMKANELSSEAAAWARDHLAIMSGLYGVLRPSDAISSYRLEMKAPFGVNGAKDLYAFWDKKLSEYIEGRAEGLIISACSDEYSKAVLRHVTSRTRIVTPVFFDTKPSGKVGTVPIYSKMMRGVFARWMIDNRVEDAVELQNFTAHGYAYDAVLSKPDFPAYYRAHMKPLVF